MHDNCFHEVSAALTLVCNVCLSNTAQHQCERRDVLATMEFRGTTDDLDAGDSSEFGG